MKLNLMRVGFVLVLFGMASAGATIASDSVNWPGPVQSVDIPAKSETAFTYYPIRRTVRAIVESSIDFEGKLYILGETQIKRWLNEDIFEPLATFDVFGGLSADFQPPNRGFYAFIVYNDSNETQKVSFRFTEYGLEYDLLTVSGALLIVGSVLIFVWVCIKAFARKK